MKDKHTPEQIFGKDFKGPKRILDLGWERELQKFKNQAGTNVKR